MEFVGASNASWLVRALQNSGMFWLMIAPPSLRVQAKLVGHTDIEHVCKAQA